ncbi:MAG TPA: hypothetical protein VG367_10955 [Mucilaginibacter sp.]|jgi:hypothetical protein|nr:hypothetical protein [Mucilaginibacter sp.]
MTKESNWDFAPTGGSPDDGIHNSMIEHFAGNYNYHLAREIIQNSLDAKVDGALGPVKVEFKMEFFNHVDFPDYNGLVKILDKCRDYWNDFDTNKFIDNAKKTLEKKSIPFLKISDFNTKGLSGGDYQKDGTWYKLVKSRGSSSKHSGEGGSFGIGKGAPFAASDLRVVFYSTNNEGGFTIFQGIAELVSFDQDDEVKRGIGSFGDGQLSLKDRKRYPERFWRREKGTDIYIAGYKNNSGWENDLIKSILRNFWYAIFNNELVVKIEQQEINSDNLELYLSNNFSGEPFRDDVEPIGNPLQYYLTVRRGAKFSNTLKETGEVSFYFLETEEFLNHVAMMRKSHMIIFSRLFRFPGNYSGVFICNDKNGNGELRKMEPPAHDKWIVERNPEKGKIIFEEITAFIKDCLDKSKIIKNSTSSDVPDMYKYLPDNEDAEAEINNIGITYTGKEGIEETSQLIQKTEIFDVPVTITPQRITLINKEDQTEDDEEPIHQTEPEKTKPRKRLLRKTADLHIRAYVIKEKNNEFEYEVVLKPKRTGKYDLKFFSVGEDLTEKLNLTDISLINNQRHFHVGNLIKSIPLTGNIETRFTVKFKSLFKNALKIDLNEV